MIYGVAGVGKSSLAYSVAARWAGPVVHHRALQDEPIEAVIDDARRQLGGGQVQDLASEEERLYDLAERLDTAGSLLVVDDIHRLSQAARSALLDRFVGLLRRGRCLFTSRELWARQSGPDRFELKLFGLERESAEKLWTALNDLYGPALGFDSAWRKSQGNPFLIRRAHAGGLADEDPVSGSIAALDDDARFVAGALAISEVPLPVSLMVDLLPNGRGKRALQKLVAGLIAEVDGAGIVTLHDLFRSAILEQLGEGRAAIRATLAERLQAAELDPVTRAREVTAHLTALERWDDANEILVRESGEIVRRGAAADLVRLIESIPREHRSPALAIVRARALGRLLDLRGAARELERLVAIGVEPRYFLRLSLAQVALATGELETAERVAEELLREAGSSPPALLVTTHALIRTHRGQGEEARRVVKEAERNSHDPLDRGTLRFCLGFSYWVDERHEEAERAMRESIACFREVRDAVRSAVFAPAFFAEVLARRGRWAECEEQIRIADAAQGQRTDPKLQMYLRASRASLLHERGERMAALHAMNEVHESCDRAGYLLGALWAKAAIGRIHFSLGRRRLAESVIEEASDLARRWGVTSAVRMLERCSEDDPLRRMNAVPLSSESTRGRPVRDRALGALHAAAEGEIDRARALLRENEVPSMGEGRALDRAIGHLARAVIARVEGDVELEKKERAIAEREASSEGADPDVVPKLYEATGRVRMVSSFARRLAPEAPSDVAEFAVVIDGRRHELRSGEQLVRLKTRPALRQLLYALAGRPGRVVSKDELARALWARDYDPLVHENALKANISHLRKLLTHTLLAIDFEGLGYRLTVPDRFLYIEG
jgi:DNA-binding response OmpR family regulator